MLRSLAAVRRLSTSFASKAEIDVSFVGSNVAHVRLNRPERRNAYTLDLWVETKKVFDELSVDPKCRAIVISGNGKSFCAGIDLQMGMGELIKTMQDEDIDIGRKARYMERTIQKAQDGFTALESCSKPVVAAVHSHCIGAGIDLIVSCDIRYASDDTVFCIKEVDIGMAADVGTLNRMGYVVGNDSWLREVAYSAREFGVAEALQHGLISRIFPSQNDCVEGALALASRLAEKSPIGVQGTKKVLNYTRGRTPTESLEMVKLWNMSQLQSSDLMDGAIAAMNKKKPTYKDV